ncbi:MAG: hypothetical protein M3R21_05705 [Candidatus Dormibacteraeota bacterium]|nr:hypothetical protein [Candidatus Dormibacteraeota bacterium]
MKKAPLPLWRVTTAVSAASLLAAVILFFSLFVIVPPGGCVGGMAVAIEFVLAVVFLAVWMVLAGLTFAGAFLSYRGRRLGPYLIVIANLPVIAFFGWWDPVGPGMLFWGWLVVALTCLPLLALLLAAVQLIAGGVTANLAGAVGALLLGALLLPFLVGNGWALDLGYAYQNPPHSAIAAHC